jgi:beta-N-acetylhexosaminidase
MGAIAKHYEIEEASLRAFQAGQDMLLICSRPELIRRGYDALLEAARSGEIQRERLTQSLAHIAELKSLFQPPESLDLNRYQALAGQVQQLNSKLNYTYGGKI